MDKKLSLAELSEPARAEALRRYQVIQPYLEGMATLKAVAATQNIPYGTVRRWVRLYRREGLTGLAPRQRTG